MKKWMAYLVYEAVLQGFKVSRVNGAKTGDARLIFENWMGVPLITAEPQDEAEVKALAHILTRFGLYIPDGLQDPGKE